jgi:hypothetical protein
MRFELIFDKDIYNTQMDVLFDLAWKRKVSYYKNSQYFGAILIFIGVVMICNRPNLFGFALIFFGLSNLIPFIYYYFKIKSTYKKFDLAKIKECEINEESTHVFEFTEKSLITNDGKHSICFDWNEFKMYLIEEGNLILITKNHEPLILGENEVGKENFQRIISFIEKKIKAE